MSNEKTYRWVRQVVIFDFFHAYKLEGAVNEWLRQQSEREDVTIQKIQYVPAYRDDRCKHAALIEYIVREEVPA